jgi:4-amino-4-deoxy-L-arabinose transferase-like glycosyltransferase
LLAIAGLLFFLDLGGLGLTDRDEGSNAEAAREMLESGDWISPTLNGEPRFAKPVFVYWLMSGAYRLLGVSEFAARFPSALFGLALILLQYAFLTRVRGPVVGLLGGLMLALNIEVVAIGRLALTDSVLIFFTTLSLFGFWLGLGGQGRARHFFWLFYVGMAIGTLTKGPVGVIVPLIGVVLYLTLTRQWGHFWRTGFPLAGTALFLILALPWYAAMLAIHGSQYTTSAQANTVGRFLNVIGGHGGTLFFYVPILLFGFFPWSGFLPAAMYDTVRAYRQWARGDRQDAPAHRPSPIASRPPAPQELELFAALWVVGVFLFFSLSATRLPHYIGPLYPAAAILAASYWNRCLTDPATPGIRASIHGVIGLGFLLAIALASSSVLYSTFVDTIAQEFPFASQVTPGQGPFTAGLMLLMGMGLVGYFGLSEQRRAGAFWAAGATIGLVMLLAIQVTLPRFSRYFISPPQELAFIAGANLGQQDRLMLYGPPKPSLIFYARRKVIVIRPGQEETMRPWLSDSAQAGRTMILLPARLRPRLPPETAGYPVILERFGYLLLASRPMVEEAPSRQPSSPSPHALPPETGGSRPRAR